jgi:hypothetical protein
MIWVFLLIGALYIDLGIGEVIPLYPAYLTLLLFIPTRNLSLTLVIGLSLCWLIGVTLSGLTMVIVLGIILVFSSIAVQERYRTTSFGLLTSVMMVLTGVFLAGTGFGALVSPFITYMILRRLNIEE